MTRIEAASGVGFIGVIAIALSSAPALALTDPPDVDLANSGSSTYNGGFINVAGQANAFFAADNTQPVGTGVFNPFLRLQVTGSGTPRNASEQGYNTSYFQPHQVFDNKSPVNWTHDVKFSDLQVVTKNNVQYYEFKLDINEPGVAPDSLLSLDGLKLFSTNTPSQSSTSVDNKGNWTGGGAGVNNLLWDMDRDLGGNPAANDRYVLLDGNRSSGGSGIADMVALFEKSAIDAARAAGGNGEYLILWSRFGLNYEAWDAGATADGGFEEWSFLAKSGTTVNPPGGSVPLPATSLLLALGALGLMARPRRSSAVLPRAG